MRISSMFKDQAYLPAKTKWAIVALAAGPPLLCILIPFLWIVLFFFLLALPQLGWMCRCFYSKDSVAITCGGIIGANAVLTGMVVFALCKPAVEPLYWILYWPMAAIAVLVGALAGKLVDKLKKS